MTFERSRIGTFVQTIILLGKLAKNRKNNTLMVFLSFLLSLWRFKHMNERSNLVVKLERLRPAEHLKHKLKA